MTIRMIWILKLRKMDRIKEIWNLLLLNHSKLEGIEKIRFSDKCPCDIYLGIKTPEISKLLAIRISLKNGKELRKVRSIKGLKIEKIIDSENNGYILLSLILSEAQFQDIFDVLIADIISHVINLSDEKKIIKDFFDRLNKWQALFEKFNPEGLTVESQHGLYGELIVLKFLISEIDDKIKAVQSWVGSEHAVQDFQRDDWAIEVKTSSGNNAQKIHISNERQLDETWIKHLFLYQLVYDIRPGPGQSLNQLVDEIKLLLTSENTAYHLFNEKLIAAGYFEAHKKLYSEITYNKRESNIYKVEGEFPRIKPDSIPLGVSEVKYSLNTAECKDYIITESSFIEIIR